MFPSTKLYEIYCTFIHNILEGCKRFKSELLSLSCSLVDTVSLQTRAKKLIISSVPTITLNISGATNSTKLT